MSDLADVAPSACVAGHSPGGLALPRQVLADLRTDHAGETGAVCIYLGVLRFWYHMDLVLALALCCFSVNLRYQVQPL